MPGHMDRWKHASIVRQDVCIHMKTGSFSQNSGIRSSFAGTDRL